MIKKQKKDNDILLTLKDRYGFYDHVRTNKVIYYDANGKIDRFTTYINNNDWVMPVFFIVSIILVGIVEGL